MSGGALLPSRFTRIGIAEERGANKRNKLWLQKVAVPSAAACSPLGNGAFGAWALIRQRRTALPPLMARLLANGKPAKDWRAKGSNGWCRLTSLWNSVWGIWSKRHYAQQNNPVWFEGTFPVRKKNGEKTTQFCSYGHWTNANIFNTFYEKSCDVHPNLFQNLLGLINLQYVSAHTFICLVCKIFFSPIFGVFTALGMQRTY